MLQLNSPPRKTPHDISQHSHAPAFTVKRLTGQDRTGALGKCFDLHSTIAQLPSSK